ncbi:dTMP kinase [Treponema sp.]
MVVQNFVIFEGGDGTGTSTQLSLLQETFSSLQSPPSYHLCFEPSEGPIGTLVRSALKQEIELCPQTIARLFAADRGEHLYSEHGIIARCKKGELVVCDRYVPSSLVYQGLECGDALPSLLNSEFPYPELIIYFDLDPRIAVKRFADRKVKDVYEHLDFQLKVQERYEALLPKYLEGGSQLIRLDASQSVEEVAQEVWRALCTLPILKG